MHEWALAEAVGAAVVKAARREGLCTVGQVTVKIGQLQQIERELFQFALQEVVQQAVPLLQETAFVLEEEPAQLQCRACGAEWSLSEALAELPHEEQEAIHFLPEAVHAYLKCLQCGSPDFEVTCGRGISVGSITGEREGS